MRMPITSVSLSSFYEWHADPRHFEMIAGIVHEVAPYINGLEFGISPVISKKRPGRGRLQSPADSLDWGIISKLPANSIHLPCFKNFAKKRDSRLIDLIHSSVDDFDIRHFTIHPDETHFIDWRWFMTQVPDYVRISVENMDIRKSDYCLLEEMAALMREFPRLYLTLDICHLIEAGCGLSDYSLLEFMHEFAGRVSKVHFSAPGFLSSGRKRNPEIMHINAADSALVVPHFFRELIPASAEWVLEGALPPGDESALKRELEFLRLVFSEQESVQIRKAA